MIAVLPILIIILILIAFTIKKHTMRLSIPVNYKKYLVIIYCSILLASTVALYFIPKNNLISITETNNQISNIPNKEDFKDLTSQGKLATSDAFTQKGNWSFDYTEKKLRITSRPGNDPLFVERKNIDDGKIEVINYVAYSSFQGININDRIKTFSVNLSKNELMLYDEENYDIKINQFNSDFIIYQFKKAAPYQINTDYLPFFAMKIMYIKIPKSLQLDDNSSPAIQMIN